MSLLQARVVVWTCSRPRRIPTENRVQPPLDVVPVALVEVEVDPSLVKGGVGVDDPLCLLGGEVANALLRQDAHVDLADKRTRHNAYKNKEYSLRDWVR